MGVLAEICSNARLTQGLLKIEFISGGPNEYADDSDWWDRDQRELLEENHLSGLLWTIFDRLSRDHRTPVVAVNDSAVKKSFGEGKVRQEYPDSAALPKPCGTIVRALFCEICKTNFQLVDLQLCSDSDVYALSLEDLAIPDGLSHMARKCWSQISKFSLALCDRLPTRDDDPLARILTAAVNLTTLNIANVVYLSDRLDSDTLSQFARFAGHCALREISLSGYNATTGCFIDLLTPFASTLKVVRVQKNYVQEGDCWSVFLRHLGDKYRLTGLVLSNLYRDPSGYYTEEFRCTDTAGEIILENSGEEAVAEALRRMCSHPTYMCVEF